MNIVSNWLKKAFSDRQVVMLFATLFVFIIVMVLFADMLGPVIAAIVLAFLLDGSVVWLEKRGLKHIWATFITFAMFLILSAIAAISIVPLLFKQILQFVNTTPQMIASLQKTVSELANNFPDLFSPQQVSGWFSNVGAEIAQLGPELFQYSLDGVAGAITLVVYTILVPVMVFFFLKDKVAIIAWIVKFLPEERSLLAQVWKEAIERSGDYARGKVYEILIVGIASFGIYTILGLKFATLLAVATGLSVLIPYIGAAVVTIPVALVAYAQWGMTNDTLVAIVAYLILQALDGNLLAPLLFSEVVKLHPNAIIIAILIFGGIWGLWGVFFAIPLATAANAIIRAWQDHKVESA